MDRQLIREKLLAVPLENRREWTEADLFGWWEALQMQGMKLHIEATENTTLATVKRLFGDLIGKNAPS